MSNPINNNPIKGLKGNTLNATIAELKKTTWPTWPEARRLTYVVIGIIVIVGIYMGILQVLLHSVIQFIIGH